MESEEALLAPSPLLYPPMLSLFPSTFGSRATNCTGVVWPSTLLVLTPLGSPPHLTKGVLARFLDPPRGVYWHPLPSVQPPSRATTGHLGGDSHARVLPILGGAGPPRPCPCCRLACCRLGLRLPQCRGRPPWHPPPSAPPRGWLPFSEAIHLGPSPAGSRLPPFGFIPPAPSGGRLPVFRSIQPGLAPRLLPSSISSASQRHPLPNQAPMAPFGSRAIRPCPPCLGLAASKACSASNRRGREGGSLASPKPRGFLGPPLCAFPPAHTIPGVRT